MFDWPHANGSYWCGSLHGRMLTINTSAPSSSSVSRPMGLLFLFFSQTHMFLLTERRKYLKILKIETLSASSCQYAGLKFDKKNLIKNRLIKKNRPRVFAR